MYIVVSGEHSRLIAASETVIMTDSHPFPMSVAEFRFLSGGGVEFIFKQPVNSHSAFHFVPILNLRLFF